MDVKQGDLFQLATNNAVIPHVCNNQAVMGAGFVVPLKKLYPHVEAEYRAMPQNLGSVGFSICPDGRVIANMIAQDFQHNPIPLYYDALFSCMTQVKYFCLENNLPIWCPEFGCGLAGGDKEKIKGWVEKIWCSAQIDVTWVKFK